MAPGCERKPEHNHAELQHCDPDGVCHSWGWSHPEGTPANQIVCGSLAEAGHSASTSTVLCDDCCGDDHPDAEPECRQHGCGLPAAIADNVGMFEFAVTDHRPGTGCTGVPISVGLTRTNTCINQPDRETGLAASQFTDCAPTYQLYAGPDCDTNNVTMDYPAMLNLTAASFEQCQPAATMPDNWADFVVRCGDAGSTVAEVVGAAFPAPAAVPLFQPERAPAGSGPFYRLDYIRDVAARVGTGNCSGNPADLVSVKVMAPGCERKPEHNHAELQHCDPDGVCHSWGWSHPEGTPANQIVCGSLAEAGHSASTSTVLCDDCCGDDHPDAEPECRQHGCGLPAAIADNVGMFEFAVTDHRPGTGCTGVPISVGLTRTNTCINQPDRDAGLAASPFTDCAPTHQLEPRCGSTVCEPDCLAHCEPHRLLIRQFTQRSLRSLLVQ